MCVINQNKASKSSERLEIQLYTAVIEDFFRLIPSFLNFKPKNAAPFSYTVGSDLLMSQVMLMCNALHTTDAMFEMLISASIVIKKVAFILLGI